MSYKLINLLKMFSDFFFLQFFFLFCFSDSLLGVLSINFVGDAIYLRVELNACKPFRPVGKEISAQPSGALTCTHKQSLSGCPGFPMTSGITSHPSCGSAFSSTLNQPASPSTGEGSTVLDAKEGAKPSTLFLPLSSL